MSERWPDVENGLRLWLRGHAEVGPLVGGLVFFGVPAQVPDRFLTVSMVGGGPLPGEAPVVQAAVRVHCWATTKKDAADQALAVLAALEALDNELLGDGVHGYGASGVSMVWQPSPETGRPRYIVSSDITARAA